MGKFTKNIETVIPFDGDNIAVCMRRLKRKDAIKLLPYFDNEKGEFNLSLTDQFEMLDLVSELLKDKKYVVRMKGLTYSSFSEEGVEEERELIVKNSIPNDEEIWDCIFKDTYFMQFTMSMLQSLIDCSFLTGEERKKLEEAPENILEDSQPMKESI